MPTRRALLRAGSLAALGLAGCLGSDGRGTPTPPATPTATAPPSPGPTTPRPTYQPSTVSLHLERVALSDVADAAVETRSALTDRQRATLDRLRANGTVTLDGVRRSDRFPFPGEPFVRIDGTFYRVREDVLAEESLTVHRFHVETRSTQPSDAVPYADLSPVDKSVFDEALTEEYRERGTPFAGTFFYAFENRSAANDSRFVADGAVTVAYRDDAFDVAFQRTDEVTATDVRYSLDEVATSAAAFREHLRSSYVRDLASLASTPDQRDLLRTAVEEGAYREKRPLSEPFSALLSTVETLPTVPNAGRYVRDDGDVYHVWKSAVEA
ncbi:MAG: hypothetical protein ABEJ78_05070 [Haloferacaceae archaeon]